jgi:hypothetical protein
LVGSRAAVWLSTVLSFVQLNRFSIVFKLTLYQGELVNKSQIDIKNETCDIQTPKKSDWGTLVPRINVENAVSGG